MKKIGNKFLLDTCFLIDLFDNKVDIVSFQKNKLFFIPSIAIGELYFGASLSKLKEKHIKKINELFDSFPVLNIDKDTAKMYADIKLKLRTQGTPIPENDIWIAALSMQYNATLITNDQHFKNIKNLNTINYNK